MTRAALPCSMLLLLLACHASQATDGAAASPADVADARPIATLVTNDARVSILPGGRARVVMRSPDGKAPQRILPIEELRALSPELHQLVTGANAANGIDARLYPQHGERAPGEGPRPW